VLDKEFAIHKLQGQRVYNTMESVVAATCIKWFKINIAEQKQRQTREKFLITVCKLVIKGT